MREPFSEDINTAAEAILAVENAPLPLVVSTPDGRMTIVNRALRELLGYGPADLEGHQIWELSADVATGQRCWRETLEQGARADHRAELRRRDGLVVRVRSAATVVADEDGAPRLVISRALAV